MSKFTSSEIVGLMEAYNDVYEPFLTEDYEIQELALEIIENAAYVLFSQGYDVEDVISYFTEATEETIVEDFVNFAEGNVILESVAVSDEYIEEQFLILNESVASAIRGAGQLVGKGASAIRGAGQLVGRGVNATKKVFTAFSKPKPSSSPQPLLRAAQMTGADKREAIKKGTYLGRGQVKFNKTGPLQKATNYAQNTMQGAKEFAKKIPGAGVASRLVKGPAGKLFGKLAPGVGVALGAKDAYERARKGDWGGAALSGLGAGLSLVPGGAVPGLGIVGIQAATDAAGLTGNKNRGRGASGSTPREREMLAQRRRNLGGDLAFRAGGGEAALKNKKYSEIQKQGMKNIRSNENTPNTAAGFDKAFADARRLNRPTFKWRGGEYTTQLAHTDLLDLIKGHLINEGYADCLGSAEIILENMSENWFETILKDLK